MGSGSRRIYTRTGDGGETGLVGGGRVAKDSTRIEAVGSLDELNSAVGLVLAEIQRVPDSTPRDTGLDDIENELLWVQCKLFDLGAAVATPPAARHGSSPSVDQKSIRRLERAIDRWSAAVPPLSTFILPGGGAPGAHLHAARTSCRRAERETLRLHRESPVADTELTFINRLSDFLFAAARHASVLVGATETAWKPGPQN